MDPRIERLWKEPPYLHDPKGKGELIHWGFTEVMLRWLDDTVKPGWKTLETGSGTSTLALASLGASHVAIDPAPDLEGRIRACAKIRDIDLGAVTFLREPSEFALPRIVAESNGKPCLNLCILDGNHAFPNCFTDFQHMSELVVTGGILFVDDILDLWQCKFLASWIRERRMEWEFEQQVGRAAIFRKACRTPHYDFHEQKRFSWKIDP